MSAGRWWRGPVLLLLAVTGFARPPEWLKPLLAEDVSVLGQGRLAVRLLDSSHVRYLPQDRVKRINRGAVRILTLTGRRYAECMYQFNANTERVIAARAWVVRPDGKSGEDISLRSFADTALKIGTVFWPQARVLSYRVTTDLPPGSVFAWEFEVESQTGITDINWVLPTDLPTSTSVIEVTPVAGGQLVWKASSPKIPAPVPGTAPGAMRWEMRGYTPPFAGGERPEGILSTTHLLSVRAAAADGASPLESWSDFARLAANVIEPRLTATPELTAKAEAIIAGKTSRWERIRALTEFVQRDITYLALVLDQDYLAGYRPNPAADVLKNRYGDCKDKAALLVTMLRATGDRGHVVLAAAGRITAVQPDWPAPRFNHAIAGIPADEAVPAGWPVVDAGPLGRIVLFDATDPNTPLGLLPETDQGGHGLVASSQSAGLIVMPIAGPEANRIEMRVRGALDERGDLTVVVEEVARGSAGVQLRAMRESTRKEAFTPLLEARLRDTLAFLEDLRWKDSWEPNEASWRLDYQFKAPRFARRTGGDLMMVTPAVIMNKPKLTPWKLRQEGFIWTGANTQRKQVRLTLPAGATVEELPDEWMQRIPQASCRLRYRHEGQDLVYDFELTQKGGFLDQPGYEAWRQFLQKVQDAERRPVLVRAVRPPPATAP